MSSFLHADQLEKEIQYLKNHIKNSQLTFVRNGKKHTTKEALEHINKKHNYFRKKIKTAEDFIKYSASKSTFSGKKYQILKKDKSFYAEDYLLDVLKKYRLKNQIKLKN